MGDLRPEVTVVVGGVLDGEIDGRLINSSLTLNYRKKMFDLTLKKRNASQNHSVI